MINKEKYSGDKYIKKQNEMLNRRRSQSIEHIKQLGKQTILNKQKRSPLITPVGQPKSAKKSPKRKYHERAHCSMDIHMDLGTRILNTL